MKQLVYVLLLLLPLLSAGQDTYYQTDSLPASKKRTYRIVLQDGTELRGELIRQDSTEAEIRTPNLGQVRINAGQIVRMEQEDAYAKGDYYPNLFPQTMRLMPTAFQPERNRFYYRNYFLYVSQLEYGISDNWSVGTTFYSFAPTNLFSLNTKLSLPVGNRLRLGINAQFMAIRIRSAVNNVGNNIFESIGYVQGIATIGDRQNNTTFGLGWGVSNGELSRNVVASFGLVRKVSPKLSFISENIVLLGSGSVDFAGIVSAGIRFDRRRHAFDLAAYIPIIIAQRIRTPILLIPFGSYHLRIGK